MSLSIYECTVPVFIRALNNMAAFLDKAKAWAEEQGTQPDELVTKQLSPDMKDLIFQIQRASDTAKGLAVRVGGVPAESMPDEVRCTSHTHTTRLPCSSADARQQEKTFADVQARIRKTIAFLEKVPRDAFDGKLDRKVEGLPSVFDAYGFTGRTYVTVYALPNFYFHEATTYAILRMAGAPVGKLDFLGKPA